MSEAAPSLPGGDEPSLPITRILDGKLLLRQPTTGHRVGTDAVLLAAATTPEAGERVIDVGSGVGSVGLAVALAHAQVRVRLVELVPEVAALARENVALNGLSARVGVDEVDLFDPGGRATIGPAEWVVSNPPFQAPGTGRPSPDALRAHAHSLQGQAAGGVGHGDWLRGMLALAGPHAAVLLIHCPEALPDLLEAARGRLGQIRVMPIHSHADRPAIRILFGGIVGSRAPFGFLPPLALHAPDGRFTARSEALHRGEGALQLVTRRRSSRPRGPASELV